jgi:hypothetical protein
MRFLFLGEFFFGANIATPTDLENIFVLHRAPLKPTNRDPSTIFLFTPPYEGIGYAGT